MDVQQPAFSFGFNGTADTANISVGDHVANVVSSVHSNIGNVLQSDVLDGVRSNLNGSWHDAAKSVHSSFGENVFNPVKDGVQGHIESLQNWTMRNHGYTIGEVHPTEFLMDIFVDCVYIVGRTLTNIITDPTQSLMELVVISVAVLALWFVWFHWDKVCFLLTGDTSLHLNHLEWLTRFNHFVCGSCEWTRCICLICCCRNRNGGRVLGQEVGLNPKSVKLSNIVVGDLPTEGRGNYYLRIEMSRRPFIQTAVVEQRLPKVIHFPETLFLQLRKNWTESYVNITVEKHLAVGHESVCGVVFDPALIHEICSGVYDGSKMRFQMEIAGGRKSKETDPWIHIDFSYPEDEHEQMIEDPPSGILNLYCLPFPRVVFLNGHGHTAPSRTALNETNPTGTAYSMQDFKQNYALHSVHDGDIIKMKELPEKELRKKRCCKTVFWCGYRMATSVCFVLLVVFTFYRAFVRSCYKEYKKQTTGRLGNGTAPFGDLPSILRQSDLDSIEDICQEGIGRCRSLVPGAINSDNIVMASMCCPKHSEIFKTCAEPVGGKRPDFVSEWFAKLVQGAIVPECSTKTCERATSYWVKHDWAPLLLMASPLILAIVLKKCIRRYGCLDYCSSACNCCIETDCINRHYTEDFSDTGKLKGQQNLTMPVGMSDLNCCSRGTQSYKTLSTPDEQPKSCQCSIQ